MKPQYRIRNWSEYNAGLKQRGSLTFWIEASVLEQWVVEELSGKPGASVFYSDLAIETMAIVKAIYRLAGRQCQGFPESIFELMGINLPVPDHSTLSCRVRKLSINLPLPVKPKQDARHVVVDSTGVKVYGEGEWKTRQHGVSKRRTWRKLHVGVDEATGEIVAMVVTTNNVAMVKCLKTSWSRLTMRLTRFRPMGLMTIVIAMTRLMPEEPKPSSPTQGCQNLAAWQSQRQAASTG